MVTLTRLLLFARNVSWSAATFWLLFLVMTRAVGVSVHCPLYVVIALVTVCVVLLCVTCLESCLVLLLLFFRLLLLALLLIRLTVLRWLWLKFRISVIVLGWYRLMFVVCSRCRYGHLWLVTLCRLVSLMRSPVTRLW